MGGVGMLQLHKITALALTAFFLISGIFAPYGSSYPFFSSAKFFRLNTDLTKEGNKQRRLYKIKLEVLKNVSNKSNIVDKSKQFNHSSDMISKYHKNDICFENDLDQKKIVDIGTSLLLSQTLFLIINLYSRLRNSKKFIEITNLSLDLIAYIHKTDGKKDKLAAVFSEKSYYSEVCYV